MLSNKLVYNRVLRVQEAGERAAVMSGIIGSLFGGGKKRTPEQVVAQLRKDLTDLAVAEAASAAAGATGRSEAEEKVRKSGRDMMLASPSYHGNGVAWLNLLP